MFLLLHHLLHLFQNREGCLCTTHDFTTSFLYFSPFSTGFWDFASSRPVHSLILSSHFFFCLPFPPFTVPCKVVLARPDKRETGFYTSRLILDFYYLTPCRQRKVISRRSSSHQIIAQRFDSIYVTHYFSI